MLPQPPPIRRLRVTFGHVAASSTGAWRVSSTTGPEAFSALERARLTGADYLALGRVGWRCRGQLNYLADALGVKGEAVSVESLHAEGQSHGAELLKNGQNPYYRNTLLSPYADRDWLLGSDGTRLSAATNPACLENPEAPVLWTTEHWEAMRRRQVAEVRQPIARRPLPVQL